MRAVALLGTLASSAACIRASAAAWGVGERERISAIRRSLASPPALFGAIPDSEDPLDFQYAPDLLLSVSAGTEYELRQWAPLAGDQFNLGSCTGSAYLLLAKRLGMDADDLSELFLYFVTCFAEATAGVTPGPPCARPARWPRRSASPKRRCDPTSWPTLSRPPDRGPRGAGTLGAGRPFTGPGRMSANPSPVEAGMPRILPPHFCKTRGLPQRLDRET